MDVPSCLSPSHNSLHASLSPHRAEPLLQGPFRSCLVRQSQRQSPKKRVVFADMKGLPLITVHNFSCDIQHSEKLPSSSSVQQLMPAGPTEVSSYTLGFSQPFLDYDRFNRCLETQKVCLERCDIRGLFLQGTVQVHNVGYEKIVVIRITFNAWTSFFDLPCVYMCHFFPGDTDIFSFQVELPSGPPGPDGTIQFCFYFQCAQQIYWDNNQGYNYSLKPSDCFPMNFVSEQISLSPL
ncbi:protein phosphatase 1 regulatory subunit 3C-like [Sarcophilus harrisii]|uniref:protein phosphatase 1 regulatory subunit 3C-like n=1 Tax=Sarcophilus harrisii TaxID=9305 RepID=UPI0002739440|nr:protein phosphatase 1 regulatory subunit 3C-like [Sarcophilus harrisii]